MQQMEGCRQLIFELASAFLFHPYGGMNKSFILCKDIGRRQFLYCMIYTAGIEGGHRPNLEMKIQLSNLILLKLQLAHDSGKVDGNGYEIHTCCFACTNPDGWFAIVAYVGSCSVGATTL
jgi:hypothetical protein